MHRLIYLLTIVFLVSIATSCISDALPDACEPNVSVTEAHSRFGPQIPGILTIQPSQTYTYNLMNTLFLADYAGSGKFHCPKGNRRMSQIDTLIVEDTTIVNAYVEQDSLLKILGKRTGESKVKVYLKAELNEYTSEDSVKTLIIVR